MIDLLVKDLAKDMTEAATQEKDDQADYVQMMRDAAGKRTTDSGALTSKSASKADMEGLRACSGHGFPFRRSMGEATAASTWEFCCFNNIQSLPGGCRTRGPFFVPT